MARTSRIAQGAAGLAIAALGFTGLAATWAPGTASAQQHGGSMQDMIAQCSSMMEAMGDMSEMMDGGMANMMNGEGMMNGNGRGMSNMMNGRGMADG